MNPSRIEGRPHRARPSRISSFAPPHRRVKGAVAAALSFVAAVLLGSCSYVERGRQVVDVAVATAHHANLAALIQAQEERIRMRKSRCYNPMLTPATIADAAPPCGTRTGSWPGRTPARPMTG